MRDYQLKSEKLELNLKEVLMRIILLIFLIFASAYSTAGENKTLIVTRMWPPEANYPLTMDSDDINQLTDGDIVWKPLWTKRNAVGWQLTEVIRLDLEIIQDKPGPVLGTIGIHLPCGNRSGVFFPEFIDIYENDKSENKLLASQKFPKVCRDGSYWKKIPFKSTDNKLLLIIKPRNRLFTLDEVGYFNETIEIEPVLKGTEDSASGLVASKIKNLYSKHLEVVDNSDPIYLTGIDGEWESFAVNIRNSTEVDSEVLIQLKDLGSKTKLYEVAPVTTATEKKVDDALLKIDDASFIVPKNSNKTIWVKTRMEKNSLSEINGSVTFLEKGNLSFAHFAVKKRVISCNKKIEKPFVVNWAYLHDMPICKNHKDQCIKDNLEHNVNVFVVPPNKIPKLEGMADPVKNDQFSNYISHIPGDNKILLFISLLQYKALVKGIENGSTDASGIIKKWLLTVNSILMKNDFGKDDWAIYAIDEPTTEHVEILVKFFGIVDAIDSDIQIYENPADFHVDKISTTLLDQFFTHVDFMQPLKKNYDQYESSYKRYDGSLWVYDIPEPPVKEISPFWYRNLTVEAWANGQKGVGFWSYDGTSQTSAWNDSDGYRADYAVVYESEKGPVSSRRWEVFSDGVEDYKIFRLYEKYSSEKNVNALRELLKTLPEGQLEYLTVRKKILNNLAEGGCRLIN